MGGGKGWGGHLFFSENIYDFLLNANLGLRLILRISGGKFMFFAILIEE